MGRKQRSPQSRSFDERDIFRKQEDFSAGVYQDLPVSQVPLNALAKLENFVNRGQRLSTRGGSKLWGDYSTSTAAAALPSIRTGYASTSTVSSNIRTISITAGDNFTTADIGRYYVRDNGDNERIQSIVTTTSIQTYTKSADVTDDTAASIRGAVHGRYFHKTTKKIILHIDTRLYVTDVYIGSWTLTNKVCYDSLGDADSTFTEFGDYVIVANSNGIFKLDLSTTPYFYWKINTPVPSVLISDVNALSTDPQQSTDSDLYPYGRKRVYSMTRLSGTGVRDRNSSGVSIEQESGTTALDDNSIDFGVNWTDAIISSTDTDTFGTLTVPVDTADATETQRHWTHYSVYATKDVGEFGVSPDNGIGNNTELLVWEMDIPIGSAYTASVDTNGAMLISAGIIGAIDVGSQIKNVAGNSFEVSVFTDTTHCTLVDVGLTTYSGGVITSTEWGIGKSNVIKASQAGTTVTISAEVTGFEAGDVGHPIFWSDGSRSYITTFTRADIVEVADSTTRTDMAGCMRPTARAATSDVTDAVLSARVGAWPLVQRFWTRVPATNIALVVPGFMFAAVRGGSVFYYSQMPTDFEYMMGYYHPAFQFSNVKDAIIQMSEFDEYISMKCRHSTYRITKNTYINEGNKDLGENIAVITSLDQADANTGIIDYGGVAFKDANTEIVITDEPAIRLFDGMRYSENIADDRIMEDLRSMQAAYASAYHPFIGFIFWGLQ